ncbi:hypothetical protein [Psychroserpens sp. MEBiC05023]
MSNSSIALTISSIRNERTSNEIAISEKGAANYQHVQTNYPPTSNTYWMVIFDRRTLKIAENIEFTDNSALPSQVAKYQNDTNYFYVLSTQLMSTPNLPTGSLYKWLRAEGAGMELTRVEQAAEALNCGSWSSVSYTIVDVFGPKDANTFEFSELVDPRQIITLKLMPIDIGGTTYYSPIGLA